MTVPMEGLSKCCAHRGLWRMTSTKLAGRAQFWLSWEKTALTKSRSEGAVEMQDKRVRACSLVSSSLCGQHTIQLQEREKMPQDVHLLLLGNVFILLNFDS